MERTHELRPKPMVDLEAQMKGTLVDPSISLVELDPKRRNIAVGLEIFNARLVCEIEYPFIPPSSLMRFLCRD